MKKNLMFTLIIWVSIFAVLEMGIRTYDFIRSSRISKSTSNKASIFVPHPFTAYSANPAHPDHNAQGYRAEKSKLYEAEASTVNIVCLGGSSTYGTRVYKEESYPYLLQEILSKPTDQTINVINGGLGGYSTPNIIALLSGIIVHLDPEIIIFYVGFNDAWNRLWFSDFKTDYSHAQKSWKMPDFSFLRYSRVLDEMAEAIGLPSVRNPHVHEVAWRRKSGSPESNWQNSSEEAFRANLTTLIGISRTHKSVPILVTQATDFKDYPVEGSNKEWMQAMDEYTKIVMEVAHDMSVDLIDIRSLMTDKKEYFADVLHMNKKGNQKRAEVIADYLIRNQLIGK